MRATRCSAAALAVALAVSSVSGTAADRAEPVEVLHGWYDMALALTRHTATFTPPVAARAYGYIGVAAYETVASGSDRLVSLAGQLNGLAAIPARATGAAYDN